MKRILACSFFSVIGLCTLAIGQPDFSRFVPEGTGFDFELKRQADDPAEASAAVAVAGEILEEVGFTSFSVWEVRTEGSAPWTLQVIETADSIGTYELFNLWPELHGAADTRSLSLPVGNLLMGAEGVFWKGKFLFIVNRGGSALGEPVFVRLVTTLAASIPMENLLPVTVSHLPGEGLVPESVRFYLGAESLRSNPLFPAPLLTDIGLSDRIEIAFGRYGEDGDGLFVIGYPTVDLAREYLQKLQNGLEGFFSKQGIYMKRSGLLIGLFVGPEAHAVEVLSRLSYKPSIQWVQEEKPKDRRQETITFLGLVTRAILGTGTLILMIIGTGFFVGIIRYGLVRRYPLLMRRDRMVRLNLED